MQCGRYCLVYLTYGVTGWSLVCDCGISRSYSLTFNIISVFRDAILFMTKVSKGAKIRNRYNQVPHLIQDTNRKMTNSQLDTTNESQEVSPFTAGDHKAHINRRAQMHRKHKAEKI